MDSDLLDKFNNVERFHWWWEGRRRLVRALLDGHTPKSILDIGCGTGETLSFLHKLYPTAKLQGIDVLPEAVIYTKKRKHKAEIGDATKLKFKASSFDALLILDVIEHINNDVQVLKEAKRVLTKDGVIIVTAPAMALIWSNHDKNQGHYRRYSRDGFETIAKKAGLTVEYISYFNFFLSPPIIFIRLLSRLPFFSFLSEYNSGFNYNIANKSGVNNVLRKVFNFEIDLAKHISFPWGISIGAKLTKD